MKRRFGRFLQMSRKRGIAVGRPVAMEKPTPAMQFHVMELGEGQVALWCKQFKRSLRMRARAPRTHSRQTVELWYLRWAWRGRGAWGCSCRLLGAASASTW